MQREVTGLDCSVATLAQWSQERMWMAGQALERRVWLERAERSWINKCALSEAILATSMPSATVFCCRGAAPLSRHVGTNTT